VRAGAVNIAAGVIACAALLAAAETARFTSKKAQEAQKKYEGALERLRAEHEAKVQKAARSTRRA
jgi:hypothetical protein